MRAQMRLRGLGLRLLWLLVLMVLPVTASGDGDACDPDLNDCWEPQLCYPYGGPIRWNTQPPWYEVPYYLKKNCPYAHGVTDGGDAGVTNAKGEWSSVDSDFNLYWEDNWWGSTEWLYDSWGPLGIPPFDDCNVVGWSLSWDPADSEAKGVTFSRPGVAPPPNAPYYMGECDTFFNMAYWQWSYFDEEPGGTGTIGDTVDVESIALHEFGHWVALGHPNECDEDPESEDGFCGGEDPEPVVMCIGWPAIDAMTGRFPCNRGWQSEMRDWLQYHVAYAYGEDRKALSESVEFADVGHGVLDVSVTDAGLLRAFHSSWGWDYVLFLGGLHVAGQAEFIPLPEGRSVGDFRPYHFNMESTVASGQFFLVSLRTSEVLYHGYVKGDSGKPFYDCWLNMTHQLVRGALGVR